MKNYLTAGHEVLLLLQLIVLLLMNLHRHKEHSQCIQKGPRVLLAEKRILEHKFPYKLSAPPRFLLTPAVDHCVKGYYLVIVFTRIDERSVRETFRNTYGRLASKYNFTILFPLGVSESRAVNDNVVKEHAKHGDILQSDFMDTYFNLPLKSYSYREYIRQHCMSVRIVLKIDDDVAWNVDSMIKYLSEIDDGDRAVLHCPSSWNPIVPRHVLYPWYIHPEEYPGKHFPSYCLSGASATTPQTIAKLAEATSTVPFVWLDDVFSNGMVPQKIGATFIHMPFGPDKFPFDSLLNGSVVAQYVLRKRGDGMYLFVRVNGNLLL